VLLLPELWVLVQVPPEVDELWFEAVDQSVRQLVKGQVFQIVGHCRVKHPHSLACAHHGTARIRRVRGCRPVRMYLSSFRVGDHPERLLGLMGSGRHIAVIANALDGGVDDARRRSGVELELSTLGELGLDAEEIDLREFFGGGGGLGSSLPGFDAVWLRGGNAFMLRYAMARSGADEVLRRLVIGDALVYAGYSSGPCVLAPSLRGLELCDDPQAVLAAYGEEPIWDGLGLLNFAIVPHYDSPGHPETELVAKVADRYRHDGVPHLTMRDGEVLVIDGNSRELV
jgi:dipeptidase E